MHHGSNQHPSPLPLDKAACSIPAPPAASTPRSDSSPRIPPPHATSPASPDRRPSPVPGHTNSHPHGQHIQLGTSLSLRVQLTSESSFTPTHHTDSIPINPSPLPSTHTTRASISNNTLSQSIPPVQHPAATHMHPNPTRTHTTPTSSLSTRQHFSLYEQPTTTSPPPNSHYLNGTTNSATST